MARGVLGSVVILIAGLITSRVPRSSWPDRLDAAAALRASSVATTLAFVLLFVGLVLLTSAWLSLGRAVRGEPDGTARVNIAAVAWAAPLLLAPPLFSGDGWSYVADGYMTGHGLSPYLVTPSALHGPIVDAVNAHWMTTTTPYGPVPLLWGGLFSRVTSDPWALMLAYRGLALVGVAMLAFAIPRLARAAGRDPSTAAWLVAPAPLLVAHGVGGLHNDVLVSGLMAMALLATVRHGWMLGAVFGGTAAAVKAPGAFVCVGIVLLALPVGASLALRARRTAGVAAVALATLVGWGLVGGLGIGWVHSLAVPLSSNSVLSVPTDLGRIVGAVLPAGPWPPGAPTTLAQAAGMLGIVAVALTVLVRTPTGDPGRALRGVALVMVAVTALIPVVHYWYALWCLPLLAAAPLRARAASLVVTTTWALGLVAPLDFSLHVPGDNLMVLGALACAVVVALLAPWPETSGVDPGRNAGEVHFSWAFDPMTVALARLLNAPRQRKVTARTRSVTSGDSPPTR